MGDASFATWLMAERADVATAHATVLHLLSTHADNASAIAARKRMALWEEIDPEGADAHAKSMTGGSAPSQQDGIADMPSLKYSAPTGRRRSYRWWREKRGSTESGRACSGRRGSASAKSVTGRGSPTRRSDRDRPC